MARAVGMMTKQRDTVDEKTSKSPDGQIDAICDAFESNLRGNQNPSIEKLILGWDEPERSKLLYELLLQEIDHKVQDGQTPDRESWCRRFPEDRDVVEEAFQKIAASHDTIISARSEETLVYDSSLGKLRYHDQGGLGVVYVAEDQRLKRDTAVKFIHDRLVGDRESCDRFTLEAEITSRLEHPGVVPIYGLGQATGGRLFYAMRFIHGDRLDVAIRRFYELGSADSDFRARDRQVQFHQLLNHFVAVCKTIAYAHNRGIVHRDIKPENVMLGRYGETIVIDWGLAIPVGRKGVFKETGEQTLTPSSGSDPSSNEGHGAGTPAYMSPEQADGRAELGPASDIYSLGVTLFKILTDSVPFCADDLKELRRRIVNGDFHRPSHLRKGISKALEAICLKAMSRDPRHRYTTALELAKDVDRYLADAPVLAYREPIPRRLARWSRKHRVLAQSLLVALLLVTLAGAGVAVWQTRLAGKEKQLRADAVSAKISERALRKQGLQVSAEFAARTIANQIDIRWRILEKEAADPNLCTSLAMMNEEPLGEGQWAPLQAWIDERREELYPSIECRSWFLQSFDGTQVARAPSHQDDGHRFSSLGQNFAFRDYFHGTGRDFLKSESVHTRPLQAPHNSTAIRSTNGGDLVVVLSVPIRAQSDSQVLGVLGMSIELGNFADLQIRLPEGQGVLLVETRKYYMLAKDMQTHDERGEGLILHHENLRQHMKQEPQALPHLDDQTLKHMSDLAKSWNLSIQPDSSFNALLPPSYRDPVSDDPTIEWLAAFAPVLVKGRNLDQEDTGWFIVVQQSQ